MNSNGGDDSGGDGNDKGRPDVELTRRPARSRAGDNVRQLPGIARIGDVQWDDRETPDSIMFLRDRHKERAETAARIRSSRATAYLKRAEKEAAVVRKRATSAQRAASYRNYMTQKVALLRTTAAEDAHRTDKRTRRQRRYLVRSRTAASYWKRAALALTVPALGGLWAFLAQLVG